MGAVTKEKSIRASPTKDSDDQILRKAARRIFFSGDITPRKIFSKLLEEEEKEGRLRLDQHDAALRRLQRRWQRDSGRFLADCKEEQAGFRIQRWKLEAQTLKAEAPELFAVIEKFRTSRGGQEILAYLGVSGHPAHLLSLGLSKVWELIQQVSPHGAAAAEEAFQPAYSLWSRFGIEPDPSFLIRMGELCLSKAAEREVGGAASPSTAEKEQTP